MSPPRRLFRIVFTLLNGLRLAVRKAAGAGGDGVHAVALTEAGKLVLVRLTYAPGWRLPGGGRKRRETQEEAMLRELREEIGLLSHGAVERLDDIGSGPGDRSALFVVHDVTYRPRRSLEIEAVGEYEEDRLPADIAPWTARILERRRLRRRADPSARGPGNPTGR